ncbi:MAG: zinc ribbon domain-containing protein, partial [Lachnospiraceae bacterium]|nr:zinc ribbon domain-containing protein [Lachnospiraceae bacterium]
MRICQCCKTRNVDESVFCKSCGTKIEENPYICPDCLYENTEDSAFCIKCGTKLGVGAHTIQPTASNRTAGFNEETAKKANATETFDYNVYMNGSAAKKAEDV